MSDKKVGIQIPNWIKSTIAITIIGMGFCLSLSGIIIGLGKLWLTHFFVMNATGIGMIDGGIQYGIHKLGWDLA